MNIFRLSIMSRKALELRRPIPDPPTIMSENIPELEREATCSLEHNLDAMKRYVEHFEDALRLFDFGAIEAEKQGYLGRHEITRSLNSFKFIACRDASLTVFHFQRSMKGAITVATACRSVRQLIDEPALTSAMDRFQQDFPSFKTMRDAVGHSAELFNIPKKMQRHSITGSVNVESAIVASGQDGAIIQEILVGRTYSTSHDGKMVEFALDEQSFFKLVSAQIRFYDAFRDDGRLIVRR